MARVKGALNARKKHKKVLKLARGYRGARSKQYRVAKQSVMKAMAFAFAGRKQTKREYRSLWIVRINAAARINNISYSKLMHGLKVAGMTIDGTNYTVAGGTSDYGVGGTGAKIEGLYQGNTRFEYTAILYGDLNGDARIDGTDANKLAVYFVRDEADASTMDYRYVAGDVNKDGAPDPADIQAIRDHYLLVEEISQEGHPLA